MVELKFVFFYNLFSLVYSLSDTMGEVVLFFPCSVLSVSENYFSSYFQKFPIAAYPSSRFFGLYQVTIFCFSNALLITFMYGYCIKRIDQVIYYIVLYLKCFTKNDLSKFALVFLVLMDFGKRRWHCFKKELQSLTLICFVSLWSIPYLY